MRTLAALNRQLPFLALSASVALAALQGSVLHGAAPRAHATVRPGASPVGASWRVAPGFVPNRGQTASAVRYSARLSGYTALFTDRAAVFAFSRHALRLQFVGASGPRGIEARDQLPAMVNYLVGSDRTRWRVGLPTYGEILYREVWRGVDLAFRDVSGEVKYELTVSPGARVGAIRLEYQGARRLSVNADGDLVIDTPQGALVDRRPRSYQVINGNEVPVETRFVVDGLPQKQYGFIVGAHDRSRPLVIDPGLVYSTYLGGTGDDYPRAIAVDASGSAYVTGQTSSLDFPDELAWVAELQESGLVVYGVSERYSNTGIFVTKLGVGGGLIYTTFLGSGEARSIAVQAGDVYVAGVADQATSLPATATFGPSASANRAFVVKLAPIEAPCCAWDANVVWIEGLGLVYSVMIGGTNSTEATGLAVDGAGNAYVVGRTESADFPTSAGAFQSALGGPSDAFAFAVNASGTDVIYSTLLGGTGDDRARGITVDSSGNAYVAGTTRSTDFPITPGAWGTTAGGGSDGFVTRLNASGSALVYSTYLGGAADDDIAAAALDTAGNAVLTGITSSADFPVTAGAFQSAMSGAPDGFITKLNAAGSSLAYSTFLGGSDADGLSSVALNQFDEVYVFGMSRSADFPTTAAAVSRMLAGGVNDDAVLMRLDTTGIVRYATYLGGDGNESAGGLAIDARGDAHVVGHVDASFPTPPGVQAPPGVNGYLAKIIPRASLSFNKPTTASSVESAEFAPGNAVDGNLTTAWSSEPSDPQWIAVDLGSSIAIERVWLQWGSGYATDSEVQVSNDGAHWTVVDVLSGSGALVSDVAFSPMLARYVRILGLKRGSTERGYSLLELDVYPPLESAPASAPNAPPTVSITSPSDGSTFTLNITFVNISFTVDAADVDGTVEKVEFVVNGSPMGYKTAVPYSGIWSATAPGTYTLTARAFDNGGAGTVSEPVTVTVLASPPNAPPTITITSPSNGATFAAPTTITVTADAADSDDGVVAVEFWVNGTLLIGTDTTAPYTAEWSTSTAGQYQLTAMARDIAQGALSQAVAITVKPSNALPTVSMTSPPSGATFTAPATITLTADAADSDGTVARVDFFANGSLIASDSTAPYNVAWSTTTAGTYTLTAQAVDSAGATAISAPVTITIRKGGRR